MDMHNAAVFAELARSLVPPVGLTEHLLSLSAAVCKYSALLRAQSDVLFEQSAAMCARLNCRRRQSGCSSAAILRTWRVATSGAQNFRNAYWPSANGQYQ